MFHTENCMCDKCINRRTIEKLIKAEQEKLANEYIARRGGLDRPKRSISE